MTRDRKEPNLFRVPFWGGNFALSSHYRFQNTRSTRHIPVSAGVRRSFAIISVLPTPKRANYGAVGDGQADDSQLTYLATLAKALVKVWKAACQANAPIPILQFSANKLFLLSPVVLSGPCIAPSVQVEVLGNLVAPEMTNPVWKAPGTKEWIQFSSVKGLIVNGNGKLDGRGQEWWNLPCISSKNFRGTLGDKDCYRPQVMIVLPLMVDPLILTSQILLVDLGTMVLAKEDNQLLTNRGSQDHNPVRTHKDPNQVPRSASGRGSRGGPSTGKSYGRWGTGLLKYLIISEDDGYTDSYDIPNIDLVESCDHNLRIKARKGLLGIAFSVSP
ncbi:hypothetical protein Sjap_025743 [Stephania japonica]|uniref:Polygalacturonase n=1 Tax=Stephania japonica TaxID=461633 RepID=A0AAP0HHU1_9MAGN